MKISVLALVSTLIITPLLCAPGYGKELDTTAAQNYSYFSKLLKDIGLIK